MMLFFNDIAALPEHHIGAVQADGLDADTHQARSCDGGIDIFDPENLRTAQCMETDDAWHSSLLESKPLTTGKCLCTSGSINDALPYRSTFRSRKQAKAISPCPRLLSHLATLLGQGHAVDPLAFEPGAKA